MGDQPIHSGLAKAGKADFGGGWFRPRAFMVRQRCNGFGKFQEDFALDFTLANAFAAWRTAGAPLFNNEAEKSNSTSIGEKLKILLF